MGALVRIFTPVLKNQENLNGGGHCLGGHLSLGYPRNRSWEWCCCTSHVRGQLEHDSYLTRGEKALPCKALAIGGWREPSGVLPLQHLWLVLSAHRKGCCGWKQSIHTRTFQAESHRCLQEAALRACRGQPGDHRRGVDSLHSNIRNELKCFAFDMQPCCF